MTRITLRILAFGAVSALTKGSDGGIVPEPDMGTFPKTA